MKNNNLTTTTNLKPSIMKHDIYSYAVQNIPGTHPCNFECRIRRTDSSLNKWHTVASYFTITESFLLEAKSSRFKVTAAMTQKFLDLINITLATRKTIERKRKTKAKAKTVAAN